MTNRILTTAAGAPVGDNQNSITAGPRGPIALQDFWLIEKLAHFDREVIPERRVHAKGSGAFGTLTVTHDISRFTKAKVFTEVGKQTPLFMRFSTVAGERGAADAGGGAHEPEFVEWRWEKMERLPDLIVPFKRKVYEEVIAEFARFSAPAP